MYECSRCNSPTRMTVLVGVSAPAELSHQFSKTNLRSKEVWLTHVNWETADYICAKTECGHVSNGYGNYVTRLEATIAELEDVLEAFYHGVATVPCIKQAEALLADRLASLLEQEKGDASNP